MTRKSNRVGQGLGEWKDETSHRCRCPLLWEAIVGTGVVVEGGPDLAVAKRGTCGRAHVFDRSVDKPPAVPAIQLGNVWT